MSSVKRELKRTGRQVLVEVGSAAVTAVLRALANSFRKLLGRWTAAPSIPTTEEEDGTDER